MTQDFWIDPYSVHWGANSHSCRTWSISRWITYQKDVKMVIFPHSCVKLPEGTSIMCSAKNVKRVGCRHHFLDGKKSFFAHSQWDWQIEFIFLKWKFFDGWGSESEGGNKDLGSKASWNTVASKDAINCFLPSTPEVLRGWCPDFFCYLVWTLRTANAQTSRASKSWVHCTCLKRSLAFKL